MKIFVLLSRVPYPLEKGDKLRAYNQIAKLDQHHEVFLCCLNIGRLHPEARDNLEKISSHVAIVPLSPLKIGWQLFKGIFSNKPFQVHYFFQRSAKRQVGQMIREFSPDHIYCQLVRTSEYVKDQFFIPKTLDLMDAFSKGIERRIASAPFYMKLLLREESVRLAIYENLIFEYFDNKTIISGQDRALIYHPDRNNIHVIPNGVDTRFYHPLEGNPQYDLLFTGNMHYPPNVDSVEYLVHEILPIVHQTRPEVNLLISGVNPARRVKKLEGDRVTVTGWVDDLRDSYINARIFIAPMNIGTGLQNKLLEAMAMQLPCITSRLANNALQAKEGESILIGRTPTSFARQVLWLLEAPEERKRIARNGYAFVREHFDTDRNASRLMAVIEGKAPETGSASPNKQASYSFS